jgi:hypothetical protein
MYIELYKPSNVSFEQFCWICEGSAFASLFRNLEVISRQLVTRKIVRLIWTYAELCYYVMPDFIFKCELFGVLSYYFKMTSRNRN